MRSLRLAIVGTGLIGASVGLAAKGAGAASVVGFDADPTAADTAASRGAIDEAATSVEAAVAAAVLAVVGVPVAVLPAQVGAVLEVRPESWTGRDVGLTQAAVCAAARPAARF